MKIWYQSMTREGDAWGAYPQALRRILDKVKDAGTEIHVARPRLQRVEILTEGFPGPVQAFVERGAGNVFHAFHQLDQALAVLELHRRKADTAIAH